MALADRGVMNHRAAAASVYGGGHRRGRGLAYPGGSLMAPFPIVRTKVIEAHMAELVRKTPDDASRPLTARPPGGDYRP